MQAFAKEKTDAFMYAPVYGRMIYAGVSLDIFH